MTKATKRLLETAGCFFATWIAVDVVISLVQGRPFFSSFPRIDIGTIPFIFGAVAGVGFRWLTDVAAEKTNDG